MIRRWATFVAALALVLLAIAVPPPPAGYPAGPVAVAVVVLAPAVALVRADSRRRVGLPTMGGFGVAMYQARSRRATRQAMISTGREVRAQARFRPLVLRA